MNTTVLVTGATSGRGVSRLPAHAQTRSPVAFHSAATARVSCMEHLRRTQREAKHFSVDQANRLQHLHGPRVAWCSLRSRRLGYFDPRICDLASLSEGSSHET